MILNEKNSLPSYAYRVITNYFLQSHLKHTICFLKNEVSLNKGTFKTHDLRLISSYLGVMDEALNYVKMFLKQPLLHNVKARLKTMGRLKYCRCMWGGGCYGTPFGIIFRST